MTEWLELMDREYLSDFIFEGGGSVKFLVGSAQDAEQVCEDLDALADRRGFQAIGISAAQTRLHRIDHVFFEISRLLDWNELAETFVSQAFRAAGWKADRLQAGFDLALIASENHVDETRVRQTFHDALKALCQDFSMSQEFRLAMVQLCRAQIAGIGNEALPVVLWLRGELPRISELRGAKIFQKIGRHNARLILQSLTHWLRRNGRHGMVIAISLTRCLENPKRNERGEGYYYSAAAVTEVYEMLRQLIDSSSELKGTFIAVFASPAFLSDEKRGIDRYQALKMRIFDDVRNQGIQNLLAPLVRLGEAA
jgi:hypothetical protein